MPTNGFPTKPLKVKLLAGEQKATETNQSHEVVTCDDSAPYNRRHMLPYYFSRWIMYASIAIHAGLVFDNEMNPVDYLDVSIRKFKQLDF